MITYPSNHDQMVQMNLIKFPFTMTIDEVDVTARGESQSIE